MEGQYGVLEVAFDFHHSEPRLDQWELALKLFQVSVKVQSIQPHSKATKVRIGEDLQSK
jgi:hypothetical protein